MNLIALHGFLGTAQDFEPLKNALKPEWSWIPNLFGEDKKYLAKSFNEFAPMVIENLEKERGLQGIEGPYTLVGYSMGGRLALHLALTRPELFEKVVLLSTHPGIFETQAVLARQAWEQKWVDVIKNSPFQEFARKWLEQDLFLNDDPRALDEKDFDQDTLINAFLSFSNTKHHFSNDDLLKHPGRIIWAYGEKDERYVQIMEKVKELRREVDLFFEIPERGHRLIAEKDPAWLYGLFSS